jgi:branched-chain amino acid transport system substrate-binding protein
MSIGLRGWGPAVLAGVAFFAAIEAGAEDRVVRIDGFGAKTGAVRLFGVNSEAALLAAAEDVNKSGGVRLGDGARGKIEIGYFDDKCNAEEGLAVIRRIASGDALAAVGPTCSNVAEPVFKILQKTAGDAADTGLQIPVFTDVAFRRGLAKISEWSFRNVPSERSLYEALFAWIKRERPELATVFGGVEENLAHSRVVWSNILREQVERAGYRIVGEAKWALDETAFAAQVADMKKAKADIVMVSAHPFSACGVLKEMRRQGVSPKLLLGLSSAACLETLQNCAKAAEGLIVPTTFAPVTPAARKMAEATARQNGTADLYSASAYEIVLTLRRVMEQAKILAKPESVQDDRAKIRAGLAALNEVDGLVGPIRRTEDREAVKPALVVQVKDGAWHVLHRP